MKSPSFTFNLKNLWYGDHSFWRSKCYDNKLEEISTLTLFTQNKINIKSNKSTNTILLPISSHASNDATLFRCIPIGLSLSLTFKKSSQTLVKIFLKLHLNTKNSSSWLHSMASRVNLHWWLSSERLYDWLSDTSNKSY